MPGPPPNLVWFGVSPKTRNVLSRTGMCPERGKTLLGRSCLGVLVSSWGRWQRGKRQLPRLYLRGSAEPGGISSLLVSMWDWRVLGDKGNGIVVGVILCWGNLQRVNTLSSKRERVAQNKMNAIPTKSFVFLCKSNLLKELFQFGSLLMELFV